MAKCSWVKLSLINGKTLTFSSDDYLKIRSEYRIIGKLIGVPVSNARSVNAINGLPAFYNEYETKLMVERGLVVLEDKTGLRTAPADEVRKEYEEHQRNVVTELHQPYIDSRLESTKSKMDQIIKGKIKKLVNSGIPESEINITPEDIIKHEIAKIQQSMSSNSVYVQVPTQHPFNVASTAVTDIEVKDARKFKVFADLYAKGFFITTGDSFGCDFLTYPGDPMYFHASQIVNIIDQYQQFDIKFLISCARLSVSVKKKCVFAYINDDDSVTYQTLQWDNPKLKQLYPMKSSTSQAKTDLAEPSPDLEELPQASQDDEEPPQDSQNNEELPEAS